MKVKELVQRIQSLYSRGVQSDDTRLTPRHIYNKLVTVRGRLIIEDKIAQSGNEWNHQTIPCVELEEVPSHSCGDCIPTIDCGTLRSKYKIPKPLMVRGRVAINSVTSVDGEIRVRRLSRESAKYAKGNKYTKEKLGWYVMNEYIYLTSLKGPRYLAITGIFEDPLAVGLFPSPCGNKVPDEDDCLDPMEQDFPIDNHLVDIMIGETINELVLTFQRNQEDLSNNNTDTLPEQSK